MASHNPGPFRGDKRKGEILKQPRRTNEGFIVEQCFVCEK